MINAAIHYADSFLYALLLNVIAAICSVVSLPIMTVLIPPINKAILKILNREDALTEVTREEREKNNIIHLYDGQYYFIQMCRSLMTLLDELVPTYVFEVRHLTRKSTKSRKTLAILAALWFGTYHLIVNTITASVIGDSTLKYIARCEEGWESDIYIRAGDSRFSKFVNGSFDVMKMRAWDDEASLAVLLTDDGDWVSQHFYISSNDTHFTFTPSKLCYASWYWCYDNVFATKNIYSYEKARIDLVKYKTYLRAYRAEEYFQLCSLEGDNLCDSAIIAQQDLLRTCFVQIHAAWYNYLIVLALLVIGGIIFTVIRNLSILPAIPLRGVSTQLTSYYLSDLTALYSTVAATLKDNKCGRHWSARLRGFGISVDRDNVKHIGVKLFLYDYTEKERKDELQISELEEKLGYFGDKCEDKARDFQDINTCNHLYKQ